MIMPEEGGPHKSRDSPFPGGLAESYLYDLGNGGMKV